MNWLRDKIARLEADGKLPAHSRVTAMREAGGVDYTLAEAQTVAWQTEFHTHEEARQWNSEVFADIAAEFEHLYAPQALVFNSIFRDI